MDVFVQVNSVLFAGQHIINTISFACGRGSRADNRIREKVALPPWLWAHGTREMTFLTQPGLRHREEFVGRTEAMLYL